MTSLLDPLEIGKLKLHNRLVYPPIATAKADDCGMITDEILEYYDQKSRGGYISLIIIEHSFVSIQGKASAGQISVAEDRMVDGLRSLADTIHKNGSKTVVQINHAGSAAYEKITGCAPVGPSVVKNPKRSFLPQELSKEELAGIVGEFRDAAVRVSQAGFDGVEIHSAHGFLLNQFYSPYTNQREDEFGGSVKNRIRIHLMIVEEIKRILGDGFPIMIRLGAADFMEGGSTIENSIIAAGEFEKAGVSFLDISGGLCGYILPDSKGQGYFSDLSKAIKENVSIPVMVTGGIVDAQYAEKLLAEERADLIGVGRAIYNDSSWAKRAIQELRDGLEGDG